MELIVVALHGASRNTEPFTSLFEEHKQRSKDNIVTKRKICFVTGTRAEYRGILLDFG